MQNYSKDTFPLSEIAWQILLLLSSQQSLSSHEIARAIDHSLDSVAIGLKELEGRDFIKHENGKYHISSRGSIYVLEHGFHHPKKPIDKRANKEPVKTSNDFPFPFFNTIQDLIYWMIFPILLSLVTMLMTSLETTLGIKLVVLGVAFLIIIIYFIGSYHGVKESTRMVVFRLGRCIGAKGPGPVLILPFIDKPQLVDMRVNHQEVPHEKCITQDNVQIDVDFVFYWKIQQPVWSLVRVTDPEESIRLLATALLRAVIAHFPFDGVMNQRESINNLLKDKIDEIITDWGVYVTTLEIREIKTSDEIVKAMEKRRAAEWESEAIETLARGQAGALKTLFAIASQIDNKTLNLKYFETLQKLGEGQATKYIFPMELSNLVQSWMPENRNRGDQGNEKNDHSPELESGTNLVKNNGTKSPSP